MAEKSYSVSIARRADSMLLAHTEFLAKVSPIAARRFLADFKKSIKRIVENPFQFPYADELDVPGIPPKTYRKCIFENRYKAIFFVGQNNVSIDAIIDCRQENETLF
jgi:plasmid stabilization system protein ParE